MRILIIWGLKQTMLFKIQAACLCTSLDSLYCSVSQFFSRCSKSNITSKFILRVILYSIEMAYIYFSKMVFYNMILRLILEGYMDYALSSLLNIQNVINPMNNVNSWCGKHQATDSHQDSPFSHLQLFLAFRFWSDLLY